MMRKRVTLALSAILLTFISPYAATLRGKVYLQPDKAAASAELSIVNLKSKEKTIVTTDEQGRFTLELPQGTYGIYTDEPEKAVLLVRFSLRKDESRDLEIRLPPYEDAHSGAFGFNPSHLRNFGSDIQESSSEDDTSLNDIHDLEVQMVRLEETVASENMSLARLVNPFPAQKRGRWHGSLYEFHRNDNLDSRNFFDPLGDPLPEYKRNQFGATFGTRLGDSLNLLVFYEGLRIIQGSTILSHVPTAAMKRGDFSELAEQVRDPISGQTLAGNRIPGDRIHPVARQLLGLLPDPNRDDPNRNFVNNQPLISNLDSLSFQADQQLDHASKILVRYSLIEGDQVRVHPLPSFGWRRNDRQQSARLSYTRSITNRFITSVRVRFERDTNVMLSKNAGNEGLLESLGISGLHTLDPSEQGYPEFSLAGYARFGDRFSPLTYVNNRFSFESTVSYTPNNHSIQFGVDFDVRQVNNNRPGGSRRGRFSFNGYYSGDAFADFLFGLPDRAYREVGSDRSDLRSKHWEFFFEDNWKVNSKFNFSFGANYYYFQPYRSIHDNVSTFYPLLFEPPTNGEIVIVGSPRATQLGLDRAGEGGLVFPDGNDWAPHLGLAYSPLGNQQLVLRTSYSIYYSPPRRSEFLPYLGRNYPFHYAQTAQSRVDTPDLDLSTPFETITPTELRIRSTESRLRTRHTQHWRLSVQSEFTQGWFAEVSYRGTKGTHSRRILTANVPLPGPGFIQSRRPNPNFGSFEILTGSGSYTRHSLNLALERRLSDGLSLKSGFSWSRLFSDSFRRYPSNPRNLRAERAPSSFTPTRLFFLNYIYDLPFGSRDPNGAAGRLQWLLDGWRLSGITNIQDGTLFSVTLPGDPNNDGVSGDRPHRLGSGRLDSAQRSIDQWFATGDFEVPAGYTFGNSGRNILSGPSFQNWDLSLVKRTPLSDGEVVEFRVELFNAFNQVNFDSPDAVLGTSLFAKIFGAKRSREIEIAVKYSF
ncbi:hypothetical protein MYX84_11465 [Acidobacteria bacterium AH-259-O06]|nr:hypothetical protein [Acidobacteria bacterium AH-259-O06]